MALDGDVVVLVDTDAIISGIPSLLTSPTLSKLPPNTNPDAVKHVVSPFGAFVCTNCTSVASIPMNAM